MRPKDLFSPLEQKFSNDHRRLIHDLTLGRVIIDFETV